MTRLTWWIAFSIGKTFTCLEHYHCWYLYFSRFLSTVVQFVCQYSLFRMTQIYTYRHLLYISTFNILCVDIYIYTFMWSSLLQLHHCCSLSLCIPHNLQCWANGQQFHLGTIVGDPNLTHWHPGLSYRHSLMAGQPTPPGPRTPPALLRAY